MKRFLFTFMAIMFFVMQGWTQTTLNESFEGATFPPENWTIATTAGSGSWQSSTIIAHAGTKSAKSDYDGCTRWLITPKLSVTSDASTFAFWIATDDWYDYGDNIDILVSTTDNQTSSFSTTSLLSLTEDSVTTTWVQHSVNLSAYIGQDIYVAIRVVDNYGFATFIDDVTGPNLFVPTCTKPTLITSSNITTTNADITWTPGNTTDLSWYLYYKTESATIYDSIHVSGTPAYSFTNLSPNTLYNIYLKTDCGTELSESTDISNFRTSCEAISFLPWTENFDTYGTGGTSIMPPCWVGTTTIIGNPHISSGGHLGSGNCLYFYAGGTLGTYNIAVLPQMDVNNFPISNLKMRFYYKSLYTTDKLIIGIMTDPTNATTFDSITTITSPLTSTWAPYEVNLSAYTGSGQYLAMKNVYTTNNVTGAYAFVDDLIIDIIPSCSRPDSLHATNITQTEANIHFSPANISDSQWKLYYRTVGTSTWTDVNVFSVPYQLTGLSSNTAYEVCVKTLCSDATYSDASSILTFRTPCDNIITIPYTENFDNYGTGTSNSYPTCWSRNVTTSSTGGNPYIMTTNYSAPGGMYFSAYNNNRTVAVCNPIDPTIPMNTLMVEFKMSYSTIDTNGIQVGVMTDPNDFTTFVPIGTRQTISSINVWEDKVVNLNDYTGTGQYIALAAIAPSQQYARAYVDNFVVSYIPSCPNIYGLTAEARSTTSVLANWNDIGDSGEGYNIAYASNLTGTFDPTTATIIQIPTGTTLPYIISGFNAGDSVWVAVQRGCSGAWTNAIKVKLPSSAIILPYSQDFEDTTLASEWIFTSSNATTTDMWHIGAATGNSGNSMYVSSDGGVTNSYSQTSTYTYATALVEFGQGAEFNLSFDWKATGGGCCDKFSVYALPYNAPIPTIGYPVGGTTLLAPINQQSAWQNANIYLSPSSFANTLQRLIFVWYSNYSTIDNSPVAIDNIMITEPNCGRPITLTAQNISTTSSEISWVETGTAISWYLYYKPSTSTTYDSVLVSSNPPYTLNNLIPNTLYDLYIKANCSSELSNPSSSFNFRTACTAIATLPFNENFDHYGGIGSAYYPPCWSKLTTYSTYPYLSSINSSTPASLYFYATSGNYNIAILPQFEATIPINTLRTTFKMRKGNNTSNLIVGVMTDPLDANTFDSITTVSPTATSVWEEFEVNFNSYTGAGQYIAFKSQYNTATNFLYIDDVIVDLIPLCACPSALSATGTGTNINVSFTPGNLTDNEWYVFYKPATSTTWDSLYSTAIPTTITGLNLQTTYQIYAKTICSDGTSSNASQIITYTTPCSSVSISSFPWVENFESGVFTCWQQEFVIGTTPWSTASSFNVAHSGTGFANFYETTGNKTKLISPVFDISFLSTPYLSYWHMDWSANQDELKVFYRSSIDSAWNQLRYHTSNLTSYEFDSVALPNPSSTYQIAFEGMGNGYGVAIDDIKVYDGHQPVIVTTLTPFPISQTDATFQAYYIQGSETITAIGFEYKTTAATTWTDQSVTPVATPFIYQLTNLSANTNYEVRAYAVTPTDGRVYGATLSFATSSGYQLPTVTTIQENETTQTSTTLNGSFVQGTNPVLVKGFQWKQSSASAWNIVPVSAGTTPFVYALNGLVASTQYEFRAYVETSLDTTYGAILQFTTLDNILPTVTTDEPNQITNTTATFHGTITQGTEEINARGFEYKLPTEDWADATILSATGTTTISAEATNLQSYTNYIVRAYARTASDTYYGQELNFQTLTLTSIDKQPISVMMYPNPATNETKLIISGVSGDTKIVLSDVQGRILNTINTKAINGVVEQTIDVNNLAKGVYYVRIQNSNFNRTNKLIIK